MALIGRIAVVVLAALAFLPLEADAQGLTGALVGTVKDADGGVLPGALVRVASPALIGGARQTMSSDRGQWRIQILPPGDYVLTIDLSPRFAVYRRSGIRIGAGETVELTAVLQVAGIVESVTVQANADMNPRTSGMESRFGRDFIRLVPTRRYSMFSLINNTPGVSPTSPASGAINTVSVFGSAVNENTFLIDGTNFTCRRTGDGRRQRRGGDALHAERRVAATGRRRQARSQWPHGGARQLRAFQSRRADRRARFDLARRHPDDDDGVRDGNGWLHAARLGRRSEDQYRARSTHPYAAHRRILAGARSRGRSRCASVGRVHPKASRTTGLTSSARPRLCACRGRISTSPRTCRLSVASRGPRPRR